LVRGNVQTIVWFEPGGEPVLEVDGHPFRWLASWYNTDEREKTIRVSVICASP
jgi:hypothetical protein